MLTLLLAVVCLVQVAIANGAQGIGLTRTEHMFFATHQRIAAVRRMIAAVELQSPAAEEALKELQVRTLYSLLAVNVEQVFVFS